MNRVAIYCRLSDEDRNKVSSMDDSESIQNQKNLLYRYAIENVWDVYKIYSDDDYSGLDEDRPEWNNLLRDAEKGKFNIILCKSQSRFTRNMELVEKYLHNKFPEWGIRFIGLTDNSDTSNRGNKKQRQILGLTNEWYCEDISENIRAVFDSKRKEGKFIGSFAPYGYVKASNDRNRLLIDEGAACVVKMIYNLYLSGYGTFHIAQILNEKAIPNPTKYKQNTGLKYINSSMCDDLGMWNKTTIKRILKNEVYIGNMIQGKRKKISYKSKKVVSTSPKQWIRAENTHEPIIDRKDFYEVQRRLVNRQKSTREGMAHLFATKVRCFDCGSSMIKVTAYKDGKGYLTYLRCKKYSVGKDLCTSHSIRFDLLQKEITEKLLEYIRNCMDDSKITIQLENESSTSSETQILSMELVSINKQLDRIARAIKNLYLDRLDRDISNEQFTELNTSFLSDKSILEKRIKGIEEKKKEISKRACTYEGYIKNLKNIQEITPAMVNEFIQCIEICEKDNNTGEQEVIIHWLF